SKANHLAKTFEAKAEPVENLQFVLYETDILISSTNAPEIILTKKMVKAALEQRKGKKPLLLLDIAVPRDIDSTINMLDDVLLYDIDDLKNIVDENLNARKKAAAQVEALLQ